MVFHLIPRKQGGDCVDDLYRTGVEARKDVKHDWVNVVGGQALEDFQQAGNVGQGPRPWTETVLRGSGKSKNCCLLEDSNPVDATPE